MAPYVAAVLSTRDSDSAKVKLYLPIDVMKHLDDNSQNWVWDTHSNEIVDIRGSYTSMHDLVPMLSVARQCGTDTWDLR